jgi:hypothetical protein
MAINNKRLDYIFSAKLSRKDQKQITSIQQLLKDSDLDSTQIGKNLYSIKATAIEMECLFEKLCFCMNRLDIMLFHGPENRHNKCAAGWMQPVAEFG